MVGSMEKIIKENDFIKKIKAYQVYYSSHNTSYASYQNRTHLEVTTFEFPDFIFPFRISRKDTFI